ncbi:hypothetical protein Tco_0474073 [Tanacetum coccineum]
MSTWHLEEMKDGGWTENILVDSSFHRNDESNIPGTRIEPRSDKESPEVEIAKEMEVSCSMFSKEMREGRKGKIVEVIDDYSSCTSSSFRFILTKSSIKTNIDMKFSNVIPFLSRCIRLPEVIMSGNILHVHLAQSQTSSVSEQQYQLYLSMKADPQLQQQDIAIWLALQIKFERNTVLQNACKAAETSEYEALMCLGESSSGHGKKISRGIQAPSTLGEIAEQKRILIFGLTLCLDDDVIQSKHKSSCEDLLHKETKRDWKTKGRDLFKLKNRFQVINIYWELGHEHKFITNIVARRANDCLVSITEPDYKNLNKNDIEDIYLLIMNGKVPDYADTGLLWFFISLFKTSSSLIWERVYDFQLGIESYQQKVNLTVPTMTFPGIKDHETFFIIYEHVRGIIFKNSKKEKRVMRHSKIYKFCDATLNRVLEGLKSYNNYVKYGYVQKDLTKDETEYLKLFEEEIEERLKHRRQMRRWEMYLKGQPKLGLWYPKDSSFNLVAYTDSDYAEASLDRKSTTRGENYQWEVQLQALVDGKKIIITESIVRRDLQLEDAEGVDCLLNATIFEQLTLMGYEKLSQKLTFYKAFFYPQWKFLINTILQCRSSKTTAWNEFSSTMASVIICLATNQKFNFSKYIFESMVKNLDNAGKFLMYLRKPKRKDTKIPQSSGPIDNVADEVVNEEMDDSLVRAATTATSLDAEQDRGNINKTRSKETLNEPSSPGTSSGSGPKCQETMRDTIAQTRFENVSKYSNDPLLARGNTLQSGEDSLKLQELMALCTTLQSRVLNLETTNTTQTNEIASLKKRVKKLEQKKRSRTHGLKRLYKVDSSRRVESSDEEGLGEDDASKSGAATITTITTAIIDVDMTLTQALAELKSAKPKADKVVIQEPEQGTTTPTLTTTTDAITITAVSTRPRAKGHVIHKQEQAPTPTVSSQQPSQVKVQDMGLKQRVLNMNCKEYV